MDILEKIIRDNCWKFDKGYPDMSIPKDVDLLNEIVKGYKIKEEEEAEDLKNKLISIINSSDLSDKELAAYIKSISNKGLTGDLNNILTQKGYTAKTFKVGDKAMDYIIDKISDSEAKEFISYTPKSFSSAPDKGNFSSVTGLSPQLVKDLVDIEPGADAGGSAIGKGEIFLALAFNDIDNRGGGGDLNFDGKNLEVKGTGGRLGQQGGRGSDFDYLSFLGEKYLEDEELEEFLNDSKNVLINYSIKQIYDKAIANGSNKAEVISTIQKALDGVFFNKGLAKKYFNGDADFKDLADMKLKLTKLNAEAYSLKTNVGAFLFMNTKLGDYVFVDIENLEDSIDSGLFGTIVKDNIKGYQWNNPHPQMIIR
jgi:hypothetical protein|tara:strand:+ start:138 stop:1241 length:1104 start_codon:yes stop_codon:yes gene_type:complete